MTKETSTTMVYDLVSYIGYISKELDNVYPMTSERNGTTTLWFNDEGLNLSNDKDKFESVNGKRVTDWVTDWVPWATVEIKKNGSFHVEILSEIKNYENVYKLVGFCTQHNIKFSVL